jgi:ATP-binding cassette, subfamily B, bacterial
MSDSPTALAALPLKELLNHVRWALRKAWSIHASLTLGMVTVAVLLSALPAGLALTARGLVNTVAVALSQQKAVSDALFFWFALGLGLTLLEAIGRAVSKFVAQQLRSELQAHLGAELLTHAASLDVRRFEDPRLHDLMERAQQNPAEHFSLFLTSLLASVTHFLHGASLAGILVMLEPMLLLALIPISIPYLLAQWRIAKARQVREHARATKRRWIGYFTTLFTHPQSAAEAKLLNLAPLLLARFRELTQTFRQEDRALSVRELTSTTMFTTVATLVFYLTFVRVVLRAVGGELTIGDVVVYGSVAPNLRRVLEYGVVAITDALRHTLHLASVREFFDLQPSPVSDHRVTLAAYRGEIEFRQVSFTYPGAVRPSVADVSFHIRPGETIALVGESGAGKTTLIKLLARIYKPEHGSILLDEVDIQHVPFDDFYQKFSFVFQNFGRYEATAADNIAYGDWQRLMPDRGQVERIAQAAHVHAMIEAMPRGYDTALGRLFGESSLSEGQWQKLAVARAFARDAAVFILDEPTSSLDVRSEHALFSRFHQLAKGRTTILISHRFSMVGMADRIFVMDKGRLIECGTHNELLAQAGHYAMLYQLHRRQIGSSAVS